MVAVIFYLVVSKVGVTDYIPAYGDQEYFSISDYAPFKWAAPLDSAVLRGIDSLWERKGRHMEEAGQEVLQQYMQADGSLVIRNSTNTDSLLIPANKVSIYSYNRMRVLRYSMFHSQVSAFGKTLIFVLLPVFAAIFFLFFFKKIKYYGAALILATHFMVYNLCIYALSSIINIWPGTFIHGARGWLTRPLNWLFFNQYTAPVSVFIFGYWFEFIHLLYWMPWFFIAFKRLFNTVWWKNIIISYCCSRVFFFLIFGVLKKILIAFTIWTMH